MNILTSGYRSTRRLWLGRFALLGLIGTALSLRIWLALRANDIIDIQNFQLVAQTVKGQGVFALYSQTPGQYPYPPLWIWFALAAEQLDQWGVITFSLAIRLPAIVADAICVYFIWIWWKNDNPVYSWFAALFYAVNPISLIITSLHGQFDALPALFVVISLYTLHRHQTSLSAVMLGLAIATKSFPFLFLPVFLFALPSKRARIRYMVIALAPVAALLLPFILRIPSAVVEQLFGYSGVGLLGFLVVVRSVYVFRMGDHLPYELTQALISLSKWVFLTLYALWLPWAIRRRILPLLGAVGILSLFYLFYGGISPQYLVWMLPLLLILPQRSLFWMLIYTLSGTLALLGFYSYAVPVTVEPILPPGVVDARWLYGVGGILWWATVGLLFVWLTKNTMRASLVGQEKKP